MAAENPENASGKSLNELLTDEMLKKKRAADGSGAVINDQVLNYRREINPQTGKMQIVWGKDEPIPQQQE